MAGDRRAAARGPDFGSFLYALRHRGNTCNSCRPAWDLVAEVAILSNRARFNRKRRARRRDPGLLFVAKGRAEPGVSSRLWHRCGTYVLRKAGSKQKQLESSESEILTEQHFSGLCIAPRDRLIQIRIPVGPPREPATLRRADLTLVVAFSASRLPFGCHTC
jgi:hypothetical protein